MINNLIIQKIRELEKTKQLEREVIQIDIDLPEHLPLQQDTKPNKTNNDNILDDFVVDHNVL